MAVDVLMVDRWRTRTNVGLVCRANNPSNGKWALPGGRQKPEDADLVATAIREIFEKTHIEINRDEIEFFDFLDVSERDTRDGVPYVSVVLIVEIDEARAEKAHAGYDAEAFEWTNLDDITGDMFAQEFDHLRVIEKFRLTEKTTSCP
jgi:ADP-ribose pyrophosphatase YjhB (NUDIX family)